MIVYRKTNQLRIRRNSVPEPPYWCASVIAPYSSPRALPVAIDYLNLVASAPSRLDVAVCDRVSEELSRTAERHPLSSPVMIDAAEFAETIFKRGEEALSFCRDQALAALHLISTRGALPAAVEENSVVVIASWPLEFDRLEELCRQAQSLGAKWGVLIPVIYPVTTALSALGDIVAFAASHGAAFATGVPLELEPEAKQAIASSLTLDGEEEIYAMLFHADLEPLHTATERHIGAIAAEAGLADFVLPPGWGTPSNWNASIVLALAASRLLGMSEETELAGSLARSARVIAELDKPLTRVAEAASLSIIEGLDEIAVDMLSDWLETGRSAYAERIDSRWRMRRDYGVG